VRHLQELFTADWVVLKSVLSSTEVPCIILASTHSWEAMENPLPQPGTLDKLASSCWILQLQTQLQNKTEQNTHQQHQQPCSEHVGCCTGSLLFYWNETQTHQFSAVLKCVEAFFFTLSPSFLFPPSLC